MKNSFFLHVILVFSCLLTSSSLAQKGIINDGEKKRLIVTTVKNETNEKQFNKLLVMDGIRNLVAQAFYETGEFVPLETGTEAKRNIEEFTGKNGTDINEVEKKLPHVTVKPIIKKIKKYRARAMLFGLSRASTTIEVTICLEIEELDGKKRLVYGKGKAKMKSMGVFFQIRDDKINFDETGVGKALKEAVYDAVRHYLPVNVAE